MRPQLQLPGGHPALIFAGFGLALALAGRRRRRRAILAVAGLGAAVGLGRVVQGAHFSSDVVFSGLICYGVAALLALALARWPARWRLGSVDMAALRSGAAERVNAAGVAAARGGRAVVDAARGAPLWAITLAAFALIAVSVAAIDQPLALWLKRYDASGVTEFLRAVTVFGRAPGWLLLFGVTGLGLWWASRSAWNAAGRARLERWAAKAGFLFAAVTAPALVGVVAKAVLGRARPRLFFYDGEFGFAPLSFGINHNSMPSGHAIVAGGLAAGLALLWPRLWPVWLLYALTIAASRLAVTAHYLGDVVAGLWLGAFTVLALATLAQRRGFDIVAVRIDAQGRLRRASAAEAT